MLKQQLRVGERKKASILARSKTNVKRRPELQKMCRGLGNCVSKHDSDTVFILFYSMFSKIVSIILAVNCIFVVSGFMAHGKLRVLEPVLECYQALDSNEVEYEKDEEIHRDASAKESMNMTCLAMEVSSTEM